MIITICQVIGGPGKSTAAQNLAVSLSLKGLSVCIVDTDPKPISYKWAGFRNNAGVKPIIACEKVNGDDVDEALPKLKKDKGYDCLIVDCQAGDSNAMRQAMLVSNLTIMPICPLAGDLMRLDEAVDVINTLSKIRPIKTYFLLSKAPTLPSRFGYIHQAKDHIKSVGLNIFDVNISDVLHYDYPKVSGSSVLEIPIVGDINHKKNASLKRAIDEVNQLTDEVLAAVNS